MANDDDVVLPSAVGAVAASFLWRSLGPDGITALAQRLDPDKLAATLSEEGTISLAALRELVAIAADITGEPDPAFRFGEELARVLRERGGFDGLYGLDLADALEPISTEVSAAAPFDVVVGGNDGDRDVQHDQVVLTLEGTGATDPSVVRFMLGFFGEIPRFFGRIATAVVLRSDEHVTTLLVRHQEDRALLAERVTFGSWLERLKDLHVVAAEALSASDLPGLTERILERMELPATVVGIQVTLDGADGTASTHHRGQFVASSTVPVDIEVGRAPIEVQGIEVGTIELVFDPRVTGLERPASNDDIAAHCAGYFSALFEAAEAVSALNDRAHTDALTGLANRHELHAHAARRARALAPAEPAWIVAFIDVDGLKALNDTFGHDRGDEVLRLTADRLRGAVRSTDLVARLGGDEFVVLVEADGADALSRVEAALRAAFVDRLVTRRPEGDPNDTSEPISVSVSIGTARTPDDGHDLDDLLAVADRRMYRQKAARRQGNDTRSGTT
jgi:diguanylate cyclase (GGDEF)-like protein